MENVEETKKQEAEQPTEAHGLSPEPEPKPELAPQKPPTAESAEADDIFADVKETVPTVPSTGEPVENKEEASPEETIVETPRQGFKKILVTIGVIVIFASVLAGGGYWAYNNFLKPKPLSPLLNLTNTAPTQPSLPTQPAPVVEPQITDSDNDGLSDTKERELGTDPLNPDSDGDRLFDREEVEVYKTDPLNIDTDGDGYEDGAEVQSGYDPKGPGKLIKIPAGQ